MEQRENQLVSVILPAYNVANYLDDCLESIISQTYTNMEIIIVDDGSTDDTAKKADDWLSKDGRIRVIHRQNVVFRRQEIQACTMHRANLLFLLIPMIVLIKI